MIRFVNPSMRQVRVLAALGISGSVRVIIADFRDQSEQQIIDSGKAALAKVFQTYEYAVGWTSKRHAGLLRVSKLTANHKQIPQGDHVVIIYHKDTWTQPYAED